MAAELELAQEMAGSEDPETPADPRPIESYEKAVSDDEILFDDSTHQSLLYFGQTKNWGKLFISIFVLSCQLCAFGLMFHNVDDDTRADRLNVEVKWANCPSDPNIPVAVEDLECEWPDSSLNHTVNFEAIVIASILIAGFTLKDVLTCVKALFVVGGWWGKCAALILLIEALATVHLCFFFTFQALWSGSYYDAVVNSIGALFVHDLDECVFSALQVVSEEDVMRLKRECWRPLASCLKHPQQCLLLSWVLFCIAGNILFYYLLGTYYNEATEVYWWYWTYFNSTNSTNSTFTNFTLSNFTS